MLGEHFIRDEGAVVAHLPVRDDAGSFAEQIRQHAGVADRHVVTEVSHDEAHFEAPGGAVQATLRHHAAEPEALARWHLASGDLGRIKEKGDVLAKGAERECAGDTHAAHDTEHQDHAALSSRHGPSPRMAKRRRASSRARASARRAHTMFNTIAASVTAYAGHTKTAYPPISKK